MSGHRQLNAPLDQQSVGDIGMLLGLVDVYMDLGKMPDASRIRIHIERVYVEGDMLLGVRQRARGVAEHSRPTSVVIQRYRYMN